MKKFAVAAVAALAVSTGSALAADIPVKAAPMAAPPPPPWDVAFGGAIASDYVWRGITQSAHDPSVASYFEPRYNISKDAQLYVGLGGASIKFPNKAAAEIDIYGGIRPTFGPLALDFGVWYYWYPGGDSLYNADWSTTLVPALSNASFVEGYAKANYTVNDMVAVGANFYYTPSYLNTGADGFYYSGTIKFTAPASWFPNGVGGYASAEVGRQELGTTKVDGFVYTAPVDLASYTTWNVGIGWTWKVFTLDLRYVDTDLSKEDCGTITGDPHGTLNAAGFVESDWCGARFVARLSADLTVNDNLK